VVLYFPLRAPTKEEITKIGFRARVRPKIRNAKASRKGKLVGLSRGQQVKRELAARVRARTLTAVGWFPAAQSLGGNPKRKESVKGQMLGSVKKELSGLSPSVTMTNAMPGAAQTDDRAGGAMQKALDAVRDDMLVYIERKQDEAARGAGL